MTAFNWIGIQEQIWALEFGLVENQSGICSYKEKQNIGVFSPLAFCTTCFHRISRAGLIEYMHQHAYLLKIIQNYFKEFFLVLHTNPAGTYLEVQAELCPSARFEDIYHLKL